MIPKTKLQKRVVELSKALPLISQKEVDWARENIFKQTGYLGKRTTWCLECGARFKNKEPLTIVTGVPCPHCGKELELRISNKRKHEEAFYYTIFTRKKELQVLRHFMVTKICKTGYEREITIQECVQNWISPDGRIENMARRTFGSMYYDLWDMRSPMEVRGISTNEWKYNIYAKYIYPNKRIIPELRRNGFKGGLHGIYPYKLLPGLLNNPKLETLLKAKQYGLLRHFVTTGMMFEPLWPAIKICIRNNYIIKPNDAVTWCDYIEMLERFNKDIRNKKYVCPDDLDVEHDRYVEKSARLNNRLKEAEKRARIEADEEKYQEFIKNFEDISIRSDNIVVEPLKTVEEFMIEGDEMKHCVFANNYHRKTKSLVLSAKVGEERVETVEFSLESAKVVQSRGKRNSTTEHHDKIVELVNSNSKMILERII